MSNGKKNGKKAVAVNKDWSLGPAGLRCFTSTLHRQTLIPLWESEEATLFHDEVLKKASREINAILDKVNKDNKDKKRVLSLIEFQNRHMLVWATYDDIVTPDDDEATVRKALKLKK